MQNPLVPSKIIAWLKTQPASTRYEYTDCLDCLLTRYLKSCGYEYVNVGPGFVLVADKDKLIQLFETPEALDEASHDKPHRYGDALARLEAINV
jgi:hypothetical protein